MAQAGAHTPRAAIERSRITICVWGQSIDFREEGSCESSPVTAGVSRMSKARSAAATPFADAWNCAPTCRRGSNTSGASMMTASPVKRSTLPKTMRIPTSTATSATHRVERNSRTAPERNATRKVPIVARVFEAERAARCFRGAPSRPKARRVGNPAIRSSICAPSCCIDSSFAEDAS